MVILALLATLVVPKVLGQLDKARISKAKTDIRGYETALNMFRLGQFQVPDNRPGPRSARQEADRSFDSQLEGRRLYSKADEGSLGL